MKKNVVILTLLLVPMVCFSQGIKFAQGTWNEVLALAKKTNKPVFVDIYTSWFGPCKKMSQEVFPLEAVGKVYNANFICYQIDAEKGEGIELAKKYMVTAYPTYLFIKADGTLFSRALGSMEFNKFIEVSKTALLDLNDPKPMAVWDAEYLQKKNDPAFLLEFMNKRAKLGLSNLSFFNDYLQLIPESERTSDKVVALYQKEEKQMRMKDFAFQNLLKNRNAYFPKLFGYVAVFLQDAVLNTIKDAAQSKDEALLETAMAVYDQIPANPSLKCKEELYMDYFHRTKQDDQFVKHATLFCNDNLMKIAPDSIFKRDNMLLEMYNKQLASGALAIIDSAQLVQLKKYMTHSERDKMCNGLNNNAWFVFEKISDVTVLQDALRWSDRTLVLDPNNPLWMDTNANLLYKLGKKNEAISVEKDAMRFCSKDDVMVLKGFEETLKKMESGEKTWK